jgi:hypothetical protein
MGDPRFIDALDRSGEVELTVVGRQSGRESTRPVWFVREDVVRPEPVRGLPARRSWPEWRCPFWAGLLRRWFNAEESSPPFRSAGCGRTNVSERRAIPD